jgi:hypothetical protein
MISADDLVAFQIGGKGCGLGNIEAGLAHVEGKRSKADRVAPQA